MEFPVFDTKEAVPEAFRESYEEKEGKWRVKATPAPEVTDLRSALEKERIRAENEEKTRKKAEKDLADLKRKDTAAQHGITDEQLEKLRNEDAEKRKPIEERLTKLEAENRKLKLTDRVRTAALSSGVMNDRIEDAMLALERRTDLAADSDAIVVLGKDGQPTTEKLEDFLSKSFKTEKPWLYTGTGTQGSGSEGSQGGNGQGSYDPVAAGKQAAKEEKKTREESTLAFK